MEKPKNNYLVVKSNTLIRQRTSLNVSQLKIVLFLIQAIDKEDNEKGEFKNSYTLDIKDFLTLEESKHKDQLKRAKEITMELRNKGFTIVDGEKRIQTGWVSDVEYKEGSSIVEFSFSEKLKPYLLNLKKNFTAYDIRCLLRLKSSYSIIMYELIRSYKNQGSFIIYIEELKNILGVKDKYKFLKDFKKYALDKAKEETAKYCDLTFEYLPFEKQGKKILSLEIAILPTKQETPKEVLQIEAKQEELNYSIATTQLIYYGMQAKEALQHYEQKGEEFLQSILHKWKESLKSGILPDGKKIGNYPKFLEWAIEAKEIETPHEKEKREKIQKQQEKQNEDLRRRNEEIKKHLEEQEEKERQEQLAKEEYTNTSASIITAWAMEQLQQENENYQNLSQENKKQLEKMIFQEKERQTIKEKLYLKARMICLELKKQEEQAKKREKQTEINTRGIAKMRSVLEQPDFFEKNKKKKGLFGLF